MKDVFQIHMPVYFKAGELIKPKYPQKFKLLKTSHSALQKIIIETL